MRTLSQGNEYDLHLQPYNEAGEATYSMQEYPLEKYQKDDVRRVIALEISTAYPYNCYRIGG